MIRARQIAIENMHLRAIDIGIAPEPGPDSIGLVGMPVWMWAANPDEHTVGPITESASAGGITVTATATDDSAGSRNRIAGQNVSVLSRT